jgi:hypothetical protein
METFKKNTIVARNDPNEQESVIPYEIAPFHIHKEEQ